MILKVALTGNRFSGKNSVARQFEKIGIPVFHADPIIKFILGYRSDFETHIRQEKSLGAKMFTQGFLDPSKFKNTEQFNKLLEVIEFELFQAYEKFNVANHDKTYTIFHSSILFEKEWEQYFDKVINVFTPREQRFTRLRLETNIPMSVLSDLIDSEMSEFEKNSKSDYVIHSYRDLVGQVCDCDKMIVDRCLTLKNINRINNSVDKRQYVF